jgi:O-antigen/teichoic acid export membrane protein
MASVIATLPNHLTNSLRGSLTAFATQSLSLIYSLAISIMLARYLGTQGLGLYSLGIGLASLAVGLTGFGLSSLVTREVAKTPSQFGLYLGSTLIFSAVFSFPLAMLVSACAGVLAGFPKQVVIVIILSACCQAMSNNRGIMYGTLRGLSRFQEILKAEAITLLFLLSFVGGALHYGLSIPQLIIVMTAIETLIVFSLIIYVDRKIGKLKWNLSSKMNKYLLVSGFPIALIGLTTIVNMRSDLFILGIVRSSEDVGIFSVALTLYAGLMAYSDTVATGFFPSFAELSRKNTREFSQLSVFLLTALVAGACVASISVGVFSQEIITILYGTSFEQAALPLSILSIGVIPMVIGRACLCFLLAMSKQDPAFYIALAGTLVHVLTSILLAPQFGAVGSAIAALLGQTVLAVASLCVVSLSQSTTALAKTNMSGSIEHYV